MLPNTLEEIARQAIDSQKRIEALEHQRSGANRLIDSFILAGAVASITFSNIPNIYDHLLVLYYVRNTAVTTLTGMRFNADAGNNYDYIRLVIRHASTLITAQGFIVTSISLPAISSAANVFDEGMIRINHYANSVNQKVSLTITTFQQDRLTGGLRFNATCGWWRDNSPITSITLFPSAGNYAIGSRFDLYGIQGGE